MDVDLLFRCLNDPRRRSILLFLGNGERCVCTIVRHLGCEQSLASFHLKALRERGLVHSRRQGKRIMYRVADPSLVALIRQAERAAGRLDGACRCAECGEGGSGGRREPSEAVRGRGASTG
jgi:ArsR family transcriptional regulator